MNRASLICVSVVCALVVSGVASARPAATAEPTLRILFEEGLSIRQMVDRVAVVRRIAIRKRGVTPRLTGLAYKQAAAAVQAPQPSGRT